MARRSYINRAGYVCDYAPNHPRADLNGYVLQHILMYEKYHNTTVPEDCVIHHINGIKRDNSPQNLVMLTREEHAILHHVGKKRSKETKTKLSLRAKERLKTPSNHPRYLSLDEDAIKADRAAGLDVKQICHKYGISKYTYYKRIIGYRRKK